MTDLYSLIKQCQSSPETVEVILENQSAFQNDIPRHYPNWGSLLENVETIPL